MSFGPFEQTENDDVSTQYMTALEQYRMSAAASDVEVRHGRPLDPAELDRAAEELAVEMGWQRPSVRRAIEQQMRYGDEKLSAEKPDQRVDLPEGELMQQMPELQRQAFHKDLPSGPWQKAKRLLADAWKQGWQGSLNGLANRQAGPDPYVYYNTAQEWATGLITMLYDMPVYGEGALIGGGATMNPAGAMAGAFGLHRGMRAVLVGSYEHGGIDTPLEFYNLLMEASFETGKGIAVGRMTGGGKALGKAVAIKAGAGKAAQAVTGMAGEVAGMVGGESLVDLKAPTAKDFVSAATLLLTMKGASGVAAKFRGMSQEALTRTLAKVYIDTGKHPLDYVAEATVKETVRTAHKGGLIDKETRRVAEHLATIDPYFNDQVALSISREVPLATREALAEHGIAPDKVMEVTGKTVTEVEDGIAKTAISLYRNHDASTIVEEFAHRHWDTLPKDQRASFEKFHERSGDKRSAKEHFAQEAMKSFFTTGQSNGKIRALMDQTKAAFARVVHGAKLAPGAEIPPEIDAMYQKVFMEKGRDPVAAPPGMPDGESVSHQLRAVDEAYMKERDQTPLLEITRKAPEITRTIVDGDLAKPAGKYSININHDRLETPQDVQNLIETVSKVTAATMDKARRGTVSYDDQVALANDLGLTAESLVSGWKKGQAYNAEQVQAIRVILLQEGESLMALAEKVRDPRQSTPELQQKLLRQVEVYSAVQHVASGAAAEAGRALGAYRMMARSDMLRGIEQMEAIDHAGGTKKVMQLADMLVASKDGSVDGKMRVSDISSVVKKIKDPGWWDFIQEVRICGMLSGPLTHIANISSNLSFALENYPVDLMATMIGKGFDVADAATKKAAGALGKVDWSGYKTLGREGVMDSVPLGEANAWLHGFLSSQMESLGAAAKAFRLNQAGDLMGKAEMPRVNAVTGKFAKEHMMPQKFAESAAGDLAAKGFDLLGEAVRVPGRSLIAADEFFKTLNFKGSLGADAYRQALSEGLRPGTEAFGLRQAELVENPTEQMLVSAREAAQRFTFTDPLKGDMALFQRFSRNPVVKTVLPFVKTPWNILRQANQRTPLAMLDPQVRADLKAGGRRRDLALARISLGSSIMTSAATLAAMGFVTGGGPKDPGQRAAWLKIYQPYSFRLPGMKTWVSYNRAIEPFGMLLGVGADFYEISSHWDGDQEGMDKLALGLVAAYAKNFTSKTWILGASQGLAALSNADEKMESYGRSMAGSFMPFSGISRTIEKTIDPTYRQAESLLDTWKAQIPGLSDGLPPTRDMYGDPVEAESFYGINFWVLPFNLKTMGTDENAKEMIRLGMGIERPAKTISVGGADIELTPQEYDRYQVLAGKEVFQDVMVSGVRVSGTLKDAMESMRFSREYALSSDGKDGGKAGLLRSVVHRYREAARQRLAVEFPRIGNRIYEAQLEERMRR